MIGAMYQGHLICVMGLFDKIGGTLKGAVGQVVNPKGLL